MKTLPSLPVLGGLVAMALISACSTPQSRIQQNPDAFARLTPEQQQLVQKGQVALGMDAATVELALGRPDRTRRRESDKGQTEVWVYLAHEGSVRGSLYYGRGYYTPMGSRWWGAGPIYYADDDETYPRLKVEFKEGRVVSIDQETR